jgi:probable HAF family extracellular repeat protein
MKNYKLMLCVLGLVPVFTVAPATAADAPNLSFKFTKANVPGAIYTFPDGINNAGVMCGAYEDKSGVILGYILNGKKLTTLDYPNGTNTFASDLNYNGPIMVVGGYTNSGNQSQGFLYKGGKYTPIPGPEGATASTAYGINDRGAIVGYYVDSSGVTHGFLLKGTKYTTLDVPGSSGYTAATDINNHGIITLVWGDSNHNWKSSIYDGNTYKTIDVPGSEVMGSIATYLNNERDVSYQLVDTGSPPRWHSALRHNGKYYKYDFPKSYNTYGNGINDKNTLIGGYEVKLNGTSYGFRATFK